MRCSRLTPVSLASLALLGVIACGPPSLSSTDSDSAQTSASETSGEPPSEATTASEVTTSEATTASETETDDSDTFVPNIDNPHDASCDVFMQDCDDGEKCVPYASRGGNWDDFKCVPVLGDQATGEPCTHDGGRTSTDNCDASGYCWDVLEGQGICRAFCTGDAADPMCPVGSYCLIGSEGIPTLCIPTCDPIEQDCGEGTACYWANGNFNCIFTTMNIPLGEPCGFINDCAPGLGCLTAEVLPECMGSACCSNFCDLMLGDEQCAGLPGTACTAFFEDGMAPVGYENIGVCILPGS